ncbi:hypothetical protein HY631_02285 [Candidatus Uhrbacteria bacterium]|nr:hypothetical protein [Candidatus Uhrbacteria bacterium]
MNVQKIQTGPLSLYVQGEVREEMRGGHMEDRVFASTIDHLIVVCTDAVIINRVRRTLYLCRRCVRPMRGLWVIGGRRRKGETPLAAMSARFQRETGLVLPQERFVFLMVTEYLWQDREQEPADRGMHYLGHQFVVELTNRELLYATLHLEPTEFDRAYGIQEFTRDRLVCEDVHPVLLEIYDSIFSDAT